MHATIQCTCGKHLDADAQRPGDRAQCPACGNVFVIGEDVKATGIQDEIPASKHTQMMASLEPSSGEKPSERNWLRTFFIEILVLLCLLGVLLSIGSFLLLPRYPGGSRLDMAKLQVKGPLTWACDEFIVRNGRWPKNLEELLMKNENGGPYLEHRDALQDPWGNTYRYDINGPMNKGVRPDIWTESPHNRTKIGNWREH